MANTAVQDSIQSINQTIDSITKTVDGLSEEIIRWNPTEEEWSIMQILSHLAEAVPYWLKEINFLLENPGSEWGRGLQHEGRLAAVSNTEKISVSGILAELQSLKPAVEKVLGALSDEQLATESPSRNPRFGTKPISFIIDHLMVEHLSKHEGQIERNLSKVEK